ncbi:methylated-DNA--[protein]-cysteine S-methyltransferase [Serpentinicella sp. ANB-PHB4]|uniref:methylated-DNA--[protein]-cysteine S-methyltransferase n=1 Tax=Serpentinicella sp. ANB-PHB4 TaxID=3074076 RepID=UPI00285CC4AE|nr:methylated-DNA--[protein]-cysteine S-methyltransferase [Serpentinicella sp. ANB-PHB4]MDR5658991.1 methylated-DNA--[protein]-cysteine S-methyltransferase [Serpentinicella sp. ANB-PHB4]
MSKLYYCHMQFNNILLWVATSDKGINTILIDKSKEVFMENMKKRFSNDELEENYLYNKEYILQLYQYLLGERRKFSLKVDLVGTDFQKLVWKMLIEIPYGSTSSYKDIAAKIGNEKAARAVGNANNKNNIPIIIPCHRVVGINNKILGYSYGEHIQKKLLNIEGVEL